MNYQSTRNHALTAASTAAVLRGIAPDGGLYILKDFQGLSFDWRSALEKDTLGMAEQILSALLPDYPDMGKIEAFVERINRRMITGMTTGK